MGGFDGCKSPFYGWEWLNNGHLQHPILVHGRHEDKNIYVF
jgi:hypothetical protein